MAKRESGGSESEGNGFIQSRLRDIVLGRNMLVDYCFFHFLIRPIGSSLSLANILSTRDGQKYSEFAPNQIPPPHNLQFP